MAYLFLKYFYSLRFFLEKDYKLITISFNNNTETHKGKKECCPHSLQIRKPNILIYIGGFFTLSFLFPNGLMLLEPPF